MSLYTLPVSSSLPALHNNNVHLWLVDKEEVTSSDAFKHFVSLLSEEERYKWLTMRSKTKKQEYLVARGSLRIILSQYIYNTRPEKLNIAADPFGKPALENTENHCIQFNLSHTREKAVVGIAINKRIGVDIEYMNPDRNWREIASRYFHPKEWSKRESGLLSMSEFYKLWTLKEAFLKAEGRGMTVPLDHFYFDCDTDTSPKLEVDEHRRDEADPTSWSFFHQYLDGRHSMAVSVEGAIKSLPETVVVHDFMGLASSC